MRVGCGDSLGTRRILTWEMVDGAKTVKLQLAAKGIQDSDLKEGVVDTPGCAGLRSSRPQDIPGSALKKWGIWSLDIKNAFLQADGFDRDVLLGSPSEW